MAGNRPDFNLCVKPKKGGAPYTQIGVAWKDDQGRGFNIKLNPCVVLSHSDSVWINLFPADNDQRRSRKRNYVPDDEPEPDHDYGPPPMTDDDVPF